MARRCIERTATLAWAPSIQRNNSVFPFYVAVGSVAGALDASFSSQSELEIFSLPSNIDTSTPGEIEKIASIVSSARFNRLVWSSFCTDKTPSGILAAGMENGELILYNPDKIISSTSEDSILLRNSTHTAAVRGLDFNYIQQNLLGSAAGQGEILIWDMNKPSAPYSPGATKTPRLAGAEIQHLAWNRCVPHILATSSSNGVAVVWDLKNRREVFSLNSPVAPQTGNMWNAGGASASRQGAIVAWHPDVATKFLTAMEDDANPLIYMWDLRNAHAPLRILNGHSRGILSVDWCQKDSDLLLSCGKDNRTLCWNTLTGEVIGELPHANNWCFDVQWSLRNPNLISVASFDGAITFHTLLPKEVHPTKLESTSNDDPFSQSNINSIENKNASHIALKRPPKWLRRPCSVAFGFGGRLVYFNEKSKSVKISVVGSGIFGPCDELQNALRNNSLADLAESRSNSEACTDLKLIWLVIRSLFLGDKGRSILLERFKNMKTDKLPPQLKEICKGLREKGKVSDTANPSIVPPASVVDPQDQQTTDVATTEDLPASKQVDAAVAINEVPKPDDSNENVETQKTVDNTFSDEELAQGEQGIARALIYGSFDRAAEFCLRQNNFSDALLLAACGGRELFVKVRDAYLLNCAKSSSSSPSWHVIVSIITSTKYEKLLDLDLSWSEILSALLTYCHSENLVEICGYLGETLDNGKQELGAIICYLLSGNVEKLVTIWSRHLDDAFLTSPIQKSQNRWGIKFAEASEFLHKLVERTAVVMRAVGATQYPQVLAKRFVEYANIMAHNGHPSVAWSYLSRVTDDQSETIDRPEHICVLRERLYKSMSSKEVKEANVIDAPKFPFNRIEVAQPVVARASTPAQNYGASRQYPYGDTSHGSLNPLAHGSNLGSGYPPSAPGQSQVHQHAFPPHAPQQQPGYYSGQNTPFAQPNRYATPSYQTQPVGVPPPSLYPASGGPRPTHSMLPPPPIPIGESTSPQSQQFQTSQVVSPPVNRGGWNDAPPAPSVVKRPQPIGGGAPVQHFATPFDHQAGRQANTTTLPPPPPIGSVVSPPQPGQPLYNTYSSVPPPSTQQVAPPSTYHSHSVAPPPSAPAGPPSHEARQSLPQMQAMQTHAGYPGASQNPAPIFPRPPMQMGYQAGPGTNAVPPAAAQTLPSGPVPKHMQPHTPLAQQQINTTPSPASPPMPPPGDRSQIPPAHQPIFQGLAAITMNLKSSAIGAQQPRVVEDIEKRLNVLFDALNRRALPESQVAELHNYVRACREGDSASAKRIQVELTKNGFEPWMIGLKRLADLMSASA